jgi:uncharacterized MAPEG superfamily protein
MFVTAGLARAQRGNHHFLETFPFFAAAVLAVAATQQTTDHTILAKQIHFRAWIAWLPIHVNDMTCLHAAVWIASLWSILQWLGALF